MLVLILQSDNDRCNVTLTDAERRGSVIYVVDDKCVVLESEYDDGVTLYAVVEIDLYDATPDAVPCEAEISLKLNAGDNTAILEDPNRDLYCL